MLSNLFKPILQQLEQKSFPGGAGPSASHASARETLQSVLPKNPAEARRLAIEKLVRQITGLAEQECSGPATPESHADLLGALDELKLTVETSTETLLRLIYQPPQNAGLRTVIDIGLLPVLLQASDAQEGRKGVTVTELAAQTGAEPRLVARLMRLVASLGLCTPTGSDTYTANDKTVPFSQPLGPDGVRCIYDLTLPALSNLHAFLAEHDYQTPTEYGASPMRWAVGKSQFEWLAERPEHSRMFNSYMARRRMGKREWFEVYPVAERLVDARPGSDDAGSTFLIDIGGNQGHTIQRLSDHCRKKSLHLPGRLLLQDLPEVVQNAPIGDEIERMGYSFFDRQPVQGATAYFFRAILHDWPDNICHEILANTVAAMDPVASRVIIVDHVLPDATKVPLIQASMDIQMMSIGAGMERSAAEWRQLLGRAGLEIRGIWPGEPGMESVIEAAVMSG